MKLNLTKGCSSFFKTIISTSFWLLFCHSASVANNSQTDNSPLLNSKSLKILSKDPKAALEFAGQALQIAVKNKDEKQQALAFENVGRAYLAAAQPALGLSNLQKANNLFRKLNLKTNEAACYIYISSVFKELGDYKLSSESLDEGLKIYGSAKDSSGIADVYRAKGGLEWKQNNFKNAFDLYRKAWQTASRNNYNEIAAQCLNGMGISCSSMGDYNQAFAFFQKSLKLNFQNKDTLRIAELYKLIGNQNQQQGKLKDAQIWYDSAYYYLSRAGYRKELAGVRKNQGQVFKLVKEPEKAIIYFTEALTIYSQLNDTAEIAQSYIQLASVKTSIKKYTEAHKDLLTAIKLCMEAGKLNEAIEANNSLGLLFYDNGNFSSALVTHQKSVKLAREISNKNKLRLALILEGNDLMALNRSEEAVLVFQEVYNLSSDVSDLHERATAGKSLARAEISSHNFEKAEELLKKSLADFEKMGLQQGILQSMNELGNLYELTNNNTKAISVYNNLISKAEAWNDLYYFSLCNRKAGEILIKEKNPERAKPYLDKALQAALKTNNKENLKNCWRSMADYYDISGDYLAALKYYRLYIAGKDSMDKLQQSENLILRQANFEISEKNDEISHMEQQVELLEKEKELHTLALNKRNIQRNFALLIVTLLLLLVFLLWKRYKYKIKKEAELQDSLEKQRMTNQKLEDSEKELQALNASKDRFFSIIAHDIKNPLSGILGFGEHLIRNYKTLQPEEVHEIAVIINDASHNLYALLENLLSWSRLQTGRLIYSPSAFSLKEICEQTIELQKLNANNKAITVNTDLEETEVFSDINMFKLVVRNLLSNAVKFTNTGGNISITSRTEEDMAVIRIMDNGIGMTEENIRKLFLLDGGYSTRGTSNEEGTGLGLLLCKECVEKNGGRLLIKSKPGEGSTFSFTVPLNRE